MEREFYLTMQRYEDHHWWTVSRRAIIKGVLNHYFNCSNFERILEIGCGSGGNLGLFSAYGDVYAIEPDDEARKIAQGRQLAKVRKGSLPNDIPFECDFDLICLLDVLEHVDDDLLALRSINNKLRPGGKVLVTVPAYQFLWSGIDVAAHHKRRYMLGQLMRVMQEAEFKLLYSTYFSMFLFPIIGGIKYLNKILAKKPGPSDVGILPSFINTSLIYIFSSERFLIPKISLPFGASIMIVAQKRGERTS